MSTPTRFRAAGDRAAARLRKRAEWAFTAAQRRAAHDLAYEQWITGALAPYQITRALDAAELYGPDVDIACWAQEQAVDEWEAGTRYPSFEIWVGIGGEHASLPSSAIPLPARHAAIEDFWPTTLVEGSVPAVSIGAIAGGCIGGNPGLSLWNGAEARARDFFSGAGRSNMDGGGRNQVDPTGWMYGSDIAGDAERPICGLPVDPDRRDTGESRETFTSTSWNETGRISPGG